VTPYHGPSIDRDPKAMREYLYNLFAVRDDSIWGFYTTMLEEDSNFLFLFRRFVRNCAIPFEEIATAKRRTSALHPNNVTAMLERDYVPPDLDRTKFFRVTAIKILKRHLTD